MIAGAVRPLIALAAVAGLVAWGERAGTYNVSAIFHCANEVANVDAPAADILFVGNSQTGSAIDAPYVERLIAKSGARVEKLAQIRTNVVTIRMLVEDYVANRGAPQIVYLQPTIDRNQSLRDRPGRPIHSRENLAFQDWDELLAVRSEAITNPPRPGFPAWADGGYRTTAALWLDRQAERVAAALSATRLRGRVTGCQTDFKYQIAGLFPYDDLPVDPTDVEMPLLTGEEREWWSGKMAGRPHSDLLTPDRAFEVDQNRRLITFLEQAGSEVVLVGYPVQGRAVGDRRDFAEYTAVLDRETLDLRTRVPVKDRAALESRFRDPLHVDLVGAQFLSEAVATDAVERLRAQGAADPEPQ